LGWFEKLSSKLPGMVFAGATHRVKNAKTAEALVPQAAEAGVLPAKAILCSAFDRAVIG